MKTCFGFPAWTRLLYFLHNHPMGRCSMTYKTGIAHIPKGQRTLLAFPLKNGDVSMGALQVMRPAKPSGKKKSRSWKGWPGMFRWRWWLRTVLPWTSGALSS